MLVTQSGNFILRSENVIAIGTFFTFGKSCFYAGGRNCRNSNFCVSLCRNFFAFFCCKTAVLTNYTFGKTFFGAGGLKSGNGYVFMAESGDYFLLGNYCFTDFAEFSV